MKLSDVMQLKEAGYTAEEIQQLANVITEEPTAPAPAAPATDFTEKIAKLEEQLKQMNEMIQQQAIRSTNIAPTQDPGLTLQSITNSILGGK